MLVTEWSEFRRPDFARIKAAMRTPLMLDGRNIWDPRALRALGLTNRGIVRPLEREAPSIPFEPPGE